MDVGHGRLLVVCLIASDTDIPANETHFDLDCCPRSNRVAVAGEHYEVLRKAAGLDGGPRLRVDSVAKWVERVLSSRVNRYVLSSYLLFVLGFVLWYNPPEGLAVVAWFGSAFAGLGAGRLIAGAAGHSILLRNAGIDRRLAASAPITLFIFFPVVVATALNGRMNSDFFAPVAEQRVLLTVVAIIVGVWSWWQGTDNQP
jgi:hypothetical protein